MTSFSFKEYQQGTKNELSRVMQAKVSNGEVEAEGVNLERVLRHLYIRETKKISDLSYSGFHDVAS